MRIIAGTFRSRKVAPVQGMETRPTADKIKQSVFDQLGQSFYGGRALDLFAGSGNIGLEALSRGIDHVVFVDSAKIAIQTIQENVKAFNVQQQCTILHMNYESALNLLAEQHQTFDLIYIDPPYLHQQMNKILMFLDQHGMVALGGRVVCESLKEDIFQSEYGTLQKIKDTTMGITRVTIYQNLS